MRLLSHFLLKSLLTLVFLSSEIAEANAQYCMPAGSGNSSIKYVKIGEIHNQNIETWNVDATFPDDVNPSYYHYTTQTGTMYPNRELFIEVNSHYDWGDTNAYDFIAFIDWNRDNDFDDPGEEVYHSNGSYRPPFDPSFIVSDTLPLGIYRLRIRYNDNGDIYSNACTNLTNAETMDIDLELVDWIEPPLPNGVKGSCENGGLEAGDFTGWDASNGYHPNADQFWPDPTDIDCCPTNGVTTCGIDCDALGYYNSSGSWTYPTHTIMTATTDFGSGLNIDPIVGIDIVPPSAGAYTLRLNQTRGGGFANRISQTFTVDTIAPNFAYEFAFVMNEPGHPDNEQPYFEAAAYDESGRLIPCSRLIFTSGRGPGWVNAGGDLNYRDWELFFMDLRGYEGKDVTVEFTAYDCAQGAHYGYAYINPQCNPLPIESIALELDCSSTIDSITIGAPPVPSYYSYLWDNGSTSDSIRIAAEDSVYYVQIIPPLGCPITIARNVTTGGNGNPPVVNAISVTSPGTKEITESCGAAIFRLENGNTQSTDTVLISFIGSAINGIDFGVRNGNGDLIPIPDTLFIATGNDTTEISIEAIPDAVTEGWEDIIIQFTRSNPCGTFTVQDAIDIRDVVPANVDLQAPQIPPCTFNQMMDVSLTAVITGPHEITWDFGDDSSSIYGPTTVNSGTYTQNHTYTDFGTYLAKFTYRDTICDVTYTDSVEITSKQGAKLDNLVIPNIFSPNGDGKNDVFEIGIENSAQINNPEQFYDYDVDIFNRWGRLIFQGKKEGSMEEFWDGTNRKNDNSQNEGIYYYIIHFKSKCTENDETIEKHGHVTIVR